jgi:mannose-1-phosphate guanylyltransferase/mannose-6-phosphate isomerase
MTQIVHPVVMSGGAGTRLWPASRAADPKQFHALVGDRTLLRQAVDRLNLPGLFARPLVVCNQAHADLVRGQFGAGPEAPRLMLEPVGRNTAACAAAAAILIAESDPSALILLAPADHLMADPAPFQRAVAGAVEAAAEGRLVTFGIAPTRPETGYGYVRAGAPLGAVFEAAAFVEKPDLATAQAYVDDGGYLWNAGYFLFRADRMIEEMARLQPDILRQARMAVETGARDGDTLALEPAAFAACPSDSLDYAVMEKARDVAVAPVAGAGWDDLGSWAAVWDAAGKDAAGNAASGPAVLVDARDCLVRSDGPMVAVCDVEDLIVVVDKGAVLVTRRGSAQKVKAVVEALKAAGRQDLL